MLIHLFYPNQKKEISLLCQKIRQLCITRDYPACITLITSALAKYPDAPEPHNLLGILYEKTGNHRMAMRHFQVASALDPTYQPAAYNMERFGAFDLRGACAFDPSDCIHHTTMEL